MRVRHRTHAGGRARAAVLAAGSLLLWIAGRPAAHAAKNITVDNHPAPVTITTGETVTIRFEVSQAGALVQFSIFRDMSRTEKVNTDAPFVFTLPVVDGGTDVDPAPGKVALPFSFGPGVPARQYLLVVEDATNASLPVKIVPKPQAQSISGIVTNLTGALPKDAIIWAASDLNTLVASANIDANGNFTLPLPPGTYLVFAEWFGNLRSHHQVVTVGAGQQVTGLNLPLQQGQEVSGTVRDGGKPVVDAVVAATSSRGETVTMKTFRDGSYTFVVPNDSYAITVRGVTEEVAVADQPLDGVDFPPPSAGPNPAPGTLVTVAGNGLSGIGGDGRRATAARLPAPQGIAVDPTGNIYIADFYAARVRKVDSKTGLISTLAGRATLQQVRGLSPIVRPAGRSGDGGPATEASLVLPQFVTVDGAGNVYIADTGDGRIRKVDTHGIISTYARATAPHGLAMDRAGNLFIAENLNHRIRKRSPDGTMTTVAGGGKQPLKDGAVATSVFLSDPRNLTVDGAGNLYIMERGLNQILKVSSDGTIRTLAGTRPIGFSGDNGPAADAQIAGPLYAVAVDSAGNLFFADAFNHRVRKIGPEGTISTVAGSGPAFPDPAQFSGEGGPATDARLDRPFGVAIDPAGNLIIGDQGSSRIVKVVGAAAPAVLPGTP